MASFVRRALPLSAPLRRACGGGGQTSVIATRAARLSTAVADVFQPTHHDVLMPMFKPQCTDFNSGPCKKRPGWTTDALKDAAVGRSHRSKLGQAKLKQVSRCGPRLWLLRHSDEPRSTCWMPNDTR